MLPFTLAWPLLLENSILRDKARALHRLTSPASGPELRVRPTSAGLLCPRFRLAEFRFEGGGVLAGVRGKGRCNRSPGPDRRAGCLRLRCRRANGARRAEGRYQDGRTPSFGGFRFSVANLIAVREQRDQSEGHNYPHGRDFPLGLHKHRIPQYLYQNIAWWRSVLASPQLQGCPLFALDVRFSDPTHARAQDRGRVGGLKPCRFSGVFILSGSPGSNVNPGSSVGVSTRWPLGGPIP